MGSYQDLTRHASRFGKKTDIRVRSHVFIDSDTFAVVSVLAKLENACNLNCVPESIAVCCFQLYVEGKA